MYLREVSWSSGIWHVLARGKLVRGPQGYGMYLREVNTQQYHNKAVVSSKLKQYYIGVGFSILFLTNDVLFI